MRQGDRDREERGNDERPDATRLDRAQPQEDEPADDHHDDPRPREGGERAERAEEDRGEPAALPGRLQEIDRERHRHHEHRGELDRVRRRRVDAHHSRAVEVVGRQPGGQGRIVELQARQERMQVVEDVEVRPRLDERRQRDEGRAGDEHAHDAVDLPVRADDADDEVEEDEEAREERQRLHDLLLHAESLDPAVVDGDGAEHREDEDENRRLDAALTEAHAPVDEQGGAPAGRERSQVQAVRLEVERVPRHRVALDRDQEDHRDEQRGERLPAEQPPVGRDDRRREREQRREARCRLRALEDAFGDDEQRAERRPVDEDLRPCA